MKKQSRNRPPQRKRRVANEKHKPSHALASQYRKRKVGDMGIFARSYPPAFERKSMIQEIRAIPEPVRGPDDWWLLGEYLVIDGLLNEDDTSTNEGMKALTSGAKHAIPSPACMMDLAWILMHKDLDSLAMQYLERAVELAPNSRDAWSLKAICHAGNSQRAEAIEAITTALHCGEESHADRSLLRDLKNGKALKDIRQSMILRKIDPYEARTQKYSNNEQAKIALFMLKQLYALDPNNAQYIEALSTVHYVLGRYGEAKPLLKTLIDIEDGHAGAYTLLALIEKKTSKNREQEQFFYEEALKYDPNYLLALVNLASLLQEEGDFHTARPLLVRAVSGDKNNPHYAIALDLYGSNIGQLDEDFEKESTLHYEAYQLDPLNPIYKANHIISLISDGKEKEARVIFKKFERDLQALPNYDLINQLIDAFTRDIDHPFGYMAIIGDCQEILGWKAVAVLVKKAWKQRATVNSNEAADFYADLAAFAHHAGLSEIALEAWQEGADLFGADGFRLNAAVELSSVGRHAEALDIAEAEPKTLPRSWTILGNIRMSNGLFGGALEAYKTAIDTDEVFLLPFHNAFDCAVHLRAPWELDLFVEKLKRDWSGNVEAELLLARAFLLQGKAGQASQLYQRNLLSEGHVLSPEELHLIMADPDDLSVFASPSDRDHYLAVQAFHRAGDLSNCTAVLDAVAGWPKWQSDDWLVLRAELCRSLGQHEGSIDLIAPIARSAEASITRALINLEQGKYEEAFDAANQALSLGNGKNYSHPEGHSDSLALAVKASCELANAKFAEAEKLAQEAIILDPGCSWARIAMAQILRQGGQEHLASEILEEAIKRIPGHPIIVSLLVDVLVSTGRTHEAELALDRQRDLLTQNNAELLRHKLGETIALAKLESEKGESSKKAEDEWPWIAQIDEVHGRWIIAAHVSMQKAEELRSAAILYVGKVTEKVLNDKVMSPFLDQLESPISLTSQQFLDVSRFLKGGRAPSIGGIVRLMKHASRPMSSGEEAVIGAFRDFVVSLENASAIQLREPALIDCLQTLAVLRNEAAHVGDPDAKSVNQVMELIAKNGRPGLLIKSLCLIEE